jgi:hypothetical protein
MSFVLPSPNVKHSTVLKSYTNSSSPPKTSGAAKTKDTAEGAKSESANSSFSEYLEEINDIIKNSPEDEDDNKPFKIRRANTNYNKTPDKQSRKTDHYTQESIFSPLISGPNKFSPELC